MQVPNSMVVVKPDDEKALISPEGEPQQAVILCGSGGTIKFLPNLGDIPITLKVKDGDYLPCIVRHIFAEDTTVDPIYALRRATKI